MFGIQLTIFWAPPRAWVTSSALPFVAHTLSSRLQLPVLHCCCCPWWSLHSTAISKPQLFCMTPSVLGCQLQLRVHFHQWPSMASHCTKPQLFFMMPSCLQKQYHLGDSYTVPSPATARGTTLAIWNTSSVLSENTSQKISPQ